MILLFGRIWCFNVIGERGAPLLREPFDSFQIDYLIMDLVNEVNQVRNDALDNYVRLVINDLFAAMTTGIPGLGIPPLDPLKIGNITIPTLT